MAVLTISQQPLMKYGEELLPLTPKPKKYQRRVKVVVPDEVVKKQEVQPVLDASIFIQLIYAMAVKKPEWVGKDQEWYKNEQYLMLGFHLVAWGDGEDLIKK
jgi:hypothetical protein